MTQQIRTNFPPLITISPHNISIFSSKNIHFLHSTLKNCEKILSKKKIQRESNGDGFNFSYFNGNVQKRVVPSSDAFFKPLPVRPSSNPMAAPKAVRSFKVNASYKEKAITGLTAAALTASMVVPDVAEAASGVSPSFKNFLLSISAGGIVLVAILGAVIGVSNFDPVKQN